MASPQLAPPGIAAAQWRRPGFKHLADDEFWNRARSIDFIGINVYAPSMTDLLFLVLLHGVRFGIADDTRWAVDAALILRYRHDEIDWEFFVDQAIRRRVDAVTATALVFLRDNVSIGSLEGEIPPAVITRLQLSKPSLREHIIDRLSRHEHTMRPATIFKKAPPGDFQPLIPRPGSPQFLLEVNDLHSEHTISSGYRVLQSWQWLCLNRCGPHSSHAMAEHEGPSLTTGESHFRCFTNLEPDRFLLSTLEASPSRSVPSQMSSQPEIRLAKCLRS